MAIVEQPEAGRRVRAARFYRGFKKPEDLSDAIASPGFGRTTLYAIETGKAPLRRPTALAIAEACGVPVAFFEVDFGRLPELVTTPEEAERLLQERLQADAERERRRRQGGREGGGERGREGRGS